MRKRLILVLFLILSPITALCGQNEARPAPSFYVIVNPHNPVSSIDRKLLADIYLKKITRWPEDEPVQPVDLRPDLAARRWFSREILDRTVVGVKSYWQQQIFSGENVPPPELSTEQEVIQFVLTYPRSIGYVSGEAMTETSGVKVLSVR